MKQTTNITSTKMKSKIFTVPNILSFFRICLIPLIVWLYCVEQNYRWAGYILILSGATDIVDGYIARHFDMISDLGKMLDPIADKLTQASMLFCLLTRFPLMIVPFALMVIKEFYMGVSGYMIIQKTGTVLGANWHGKVTTCLLYAMMVLHVVWNDISSEISNLSIIGCVGMMALSLLLYARRNIKVLKEHRAAEARGEH